MTEIGAPGTGIERRELLAATGAAAVGSTAGCVSFGGKKQALPDDPTDGAAALDASLPTTSPPEVVDVNEQGGTVRLSTQQARHPVHPGETMGGPVRLPKVWAFRADDRDPSVPGPVLRTREGDDMTVVLDNRDGMRPHTLHFHGVRKDWKQDGVPTTTGITVPPGEKHAYEIPANVPGTHLYHCHYQTPRHIDMGMFGIFRVDPEGYERADREHFLTVKEWDSDLNRMMAGGDADYSVRGRDPDVFTVNGKSAPRTLHPEQGSPIIVEEGDTVRLHLLNGGYMNHPMHIHNHRFELVEKDGGTIPEAARHPMDVTDVAPAERHTIQFEADADPGIYLMHCHKVSHVTNGTSYPGGMLTGLVYKSAMDTGIFADLMNYAGFEG